MLVTVGCNAKPANTTDAAVVDAFVPQDAPGCGQDDGHGDISSMVRAETISVGYSANGEICATTPDFYKIAAGTGSVTIYTHVTPALAAVLDANGAVVHSAMGSCLPTLIPTPEACTFTYDLASGPYYVRFAEQGESLTDPISYFIQVR